jgi:lipid II:glycine glycyltransferase (peptidoglycan interpeptide bridge formation enzyme)
MLAGAQVLFRSVTPAFSLAYVPKAPLVVWKNEAQVKVLLESLHYLCRSRRSIMLKIEPNVFDRDALRETIVSYGFTVSPYPVQPPRTILVDITPGEEAILAAMKQKTRYNIRLAARKGVTIRLGTEDDLPTFYRLLQITSQRDGFGIHSLDYFRAVVELFAPDRAALLMAEVHEDPAACLMVLVHRSTAYYLFGASGNAYRKEMPTYLLQWEAMRWAKAHGCDSYDLWGVPDADESVLEAEFETRSGDSAGLWGVYRFKRGFGGRVVRAEGAFDFVYNQPAYWAYQKWMNRSRKGILA